METNKTQTVTIMENNKYSKEKFDDYTHRFIIRMKVDEDWRNDRCMTVYSNSDSYAELKNFINEKKSEKVIGFSIEHRASKEQDEIDLKFLNKFLYQI